MTLSLHLEEAMSNIYALQQQGEMEEQFAAQFAVARQQETFRGQSMRPLSMIEMVTTGPAEEPQPQMDKYTSMQVKQEPVESPLMQRIPMATTFADRVAYQRMRLQDLRTQGYLLINNQEIGFEGCAPVDDMRQQYVRRTTQQE